MQILGNCFTERVMFSVSLVPLCHHVISVFGNGNIFISSGRLCYKKITGGTSFYVLMCIFKLMVS